MVLVCHMISQDIVCHVTLWAGAIKASYHPVKVVSNRHPGN